MATSDFTTTFIPPLAKSPERLFFGIDGLNYSFNGIDKADTFDEYLENYIRPYAEHLSQVDGVSGVRLPMSWVAWEHDYTTGSYGGVIVNSSRLYKYRLGRILETLADANLAVTPVIWSNKTNLSGYYYPMLTMAACAYEGINHEAVVDRGIFEWMDGQDGQTTDRGFLYAGYNYWTGSHITISSNANWGVSDFSSNYIATVDPTAPVGYDTNSVTPSISSLFTSLIELPPKVPAQFVLHCKNNAAAGVFHAYDFEITTVGAASATYYWNGKEWTVVQTALRRQISNADRQFVTVWFETMQGSLDNTYGFKVLPQGTTTEAQLMINSIELYMPGSEPDVRNYFSPRNLNDAGFDTPSQMITSLHGYKGQPTIVDEIIPPFESARNPVKLPNPGMYRINNYEEFFSSTFEDVFAASVSTSDVSNLDINGASLYIDDILTVIGEVKTSHNLNIQAIDVFEYPFSVNRAMYSPRESACTFNFIQKTITEIKAHASYGNDSLMVSGTSPILFTAPDKLVQTPSLPEFNSLVWTKFRPHPVSSAIQWGLDTGSYLNQYNVFYPETGAENKLISQFDIGEYQTINFNDSSNKGSAHNLKIWAETATDQLFSTDVSGIADKDEYSINKNWVDEVLDSISEIGLYCGYDPNKNSSTSHEYPMSNVYSIVSSLKWDGSSVTVSVQDAGNMNTSEEYFGTDFWMFSKHWNKYYNSTGSGPDSTVGFYVTPKSVIGTSQTHFPIHLPEPFSSGLLSYDYVRKSVVYTGNSNIVNGAIISGASEYLNFAEYSLVTGGQRSYPAYTTVPLQFDVNRGFIYGGTENAITVFDDNPNTNIETRSISDAHGNTLDMIWSAEDSLTNTVFSGISSSFSITVFTYDGIEGSLGVSTDDVEYTVTLEEGKVRIFKGEPSAPLETQTSANWDHMWAMLPDFWTTHFEDTKAISSMWAGIADVSANMLANLYQYDLSKGVHTTPYRIISSNEAFPFENSTYYTESDYNFATGTESSSNYFVADSVDSIPVLKSRLDDTGLSYDEIEDFEIVDGSIYFKEGLLDTNSITTLFAPWISYDESMIYQSFGHFLDLRKPESDQYRNAVIAGLYGLWNGHTLNVFKLLCDALSGFPIIPYRGKVKFVNVSNTVFSLIIEDQFGNERSVQLPASFIPSTERPIIVRTGLKTQISVTNIRDLVGIDMFSLAPATNAFEVYDRKTNPTRIESLAKVLKRKRIGMYNTTVGELDANNIDKIGDLYTKLGWGDRSEMFDDIIKIIELVRGQYHSFQLLIAQRPVEEVLLKEPKPDLQLSLELEPTFDHNIFNYMHSGSDWVLIDRKADPAHVAPYLTISQEAAERSSYNPDEGRTQGQKYKVLNTGETVEADSNVYASLGKQGLKDGSRSGFTLGFDRIKKAAARLFKFKPSYSDSDQLKHGAGSFDYLLTAADAQNIGKDNLVSWQSSASDLHFFSHFESSGNGEWMASMYGDTGVQARNRHFEYPQVDYDVKDLQIRSVLGKTTNTVSLSDGLTVLTRVKPRSKGIILELSGEVDLGIIDPPPEDIGACCKPVGSICGTALTCTPPITDTYGMSIGCAEDYTCVDGVTKNQCAAVSGIWQGPGSLCSSGGCDVIKEKCCLDGKHCNQPPGSCATHNGHRCATHYQEYCECLNGVFFAGERCSDSTYYCPGILNAGPCCSEEEPGDPKVGIDPGTIGGGETWSPPVTGGVFQPGTTYTTSLNATNNSQTAITGYFTLSPDTMSQLSLDPNDAGYTLLEGIPSIFFELFGGASKSFNLLFTPSEDVSNYTGSIIGVGPDGNEAGSGFVLVPASVIIDITNAGSAGMTTNVNDLNFGAAYESADTSSRTIIVTNTGTVKLTGNITDSLRPGITLTTSASTVLSIDPAASESYEYVLDPSVAGVGLLSGQDITLTTNAVTKIVPIVGEVLQDILAGTVNGGNTIAFGEVNETALSVTNLVIIHNLITSTIPANLVIQLKTTGGAAYSGTDFELLDNLDNVVSGISTAVIPGGSYVAKVRFNPTLVDSNTLDIILFDVGEVSFSGGFVPITATTINTSPIFNMAVNVDDFGTVDIGYTKSLSDVATITNTGIEDLIVSLQAPSNNFTLTFNGGSSVATIPGGSSIGVDGSFNATAPEGQKTVDFAINHNDAVLGSPYYLSLQAYASTELVAAMVSSPASLDYFNFSGSSADSFLYASGVSTINTYSAYIEFYNESSTGSIDISGTASITSLAASLSASPSIYLATLGDTTSNYILLSTTTYSAATTAVIDVLGETSSATTTVSQFSVISMSVEPVWGPVLSMYSPSFSIYTIEETSPPVASGSSSKNSSGRYSQTMNDYLSFGSAVYGTANPTKSFVIKNTGGGRLLGSVSAIDAHFSLVGGLTSQAIDLEKGQTASVDVEFFMLNEDLTPIEYVSISTTGETGFTNALIECTGTSVKEVINIDVSPLNIAFGTVDPGSATVSDNIVVTHLGSSNADAYITASITNTAGGVFTIISPASWASMQTLSNDSVSYEVEFTPLASSLSGDTVHTGEIQLVHNASRVSPVLIPITATTRQNVANVTTAESSVDFGMVDVGFTHTLTNAFTITNEGNGDAAILLGAFGDYTLAQNGTGVTLFTLSPAASTTLDATYTPTSLGDDALPVTISVDPSPMLLLKGVGVSADPYLYITSSSVAWNSNITIVDTGSSSALTIVNGGTIVGRGNLTVTSSSIGIGNSIDDWVVNNDGTTASSAEYVTYNGASYYPKFIRALDTASNGEWMYIVDQNIVLNSIVNLPAFRPHLIRTDTGVIAPSDVVPSDHPNGNGIHVYTGGFNAAQQLVSPFIPDGSVLYVQFTMKNIGVGTVSPTISGFDFNSSIFGPVLDKSTGLPISSFSIGAGASKNMLIKLTMPSEAGHYSGILLFDTTAEPFMLDIVVEPMPAGAGSTNNFCKCCMNKGTPYVYCSSLPESECYAQGGTPNDPDCEDSGSMGTIPT